MKSLLWHIDLSLTYLDFPPEDSTLIRTTDKIDKPFFVFREVLKRAPERPPTSLA